MAGSSGTAWDAMAQEAFLDGPMPDIVAQWRHYLDVLAPHRDDRVLDVGCDTGDALRLFASERPDLAALVGLEYDGRRARRAVARWRAGGHDPRVGFQRGDGRALPYADHVFDRVICTEALEFVEPPIRALHDIRRVLKPGGAALIVHTDWDTQLFATRDPARSRRLVTAFAAEGRGDMGRRLHHLCRAAGFCGVATSVYTVVNTTWRDDHYAPRVVKLMTQWLAHNPAVSSEDLRAWQDDLDAAVADNSFFYSVARYVCRCTP